MTQNENQKPESRLFLFDEMVEAIGKSVDNVVNVIADQELMLDILSKSEHAEHFADFIKANKEQIVNLTAQKDELIARKAHIEKALVLARYNKFVNEAVEELIDGLGLFKK